MLEAINAGIGEVVPDAELNPIAFVLVPLQEKEVPVPEFGEDAVKLICATFAPEQAKIFEIGVATGFGFIVIV